MKESTFSLNTLKNFAREALKKDTDDLFMKKTQLNALIELINNYPNELIHIINIMISNIDTQMHAFGLCTECGTELEHDCSKTTVDLTYKNGVVETLVSITKVCPNCRHTETSNYTF